MDEILYLEKLRKRALIQRNCEDNPALRDGAFLMCQKDILFAFDNFFWTYDPRKKPSDLAFFPYQYQETFITETNQDIQNGVDSLTEKSRDMGVTWMVLSIYVYRWLFFDENFLVGSRKQELVDTIGDMDSHFERIRYILKKLPDWVIDKCGWDRKLSGFMKVYKNNGSSITGEAMSTDFSRQGRYNSILLDEFAFVQGAEEIDRACGESSPCKLYVSTPNGKNNHFARIRASGKVKVNTIHWRLHPNKDEAWYQAVKAKRTEKDVAQELDISYSVSAGSPFYKGFYRSLHVKKLVANPDCDLILGWDYGFHHPNCSIHQVTPEGVWVILDNIFGEDIIIDEFAMIVKEYLNENYRGFNYTNKNFGDPAGLQTSDKSKKSSAQILREHGFYVRSLPSNTPQTNYTARKNIIEKKLKTLIAGSPALMINDTPNNDIIIEGFEGGYHYPKANVVGHVHEYPEKEGYYEHPFNSIEYVATNLFRTLERTSTPMQNRGKIFRSKQQPTNMGFSFAGVK